MLVPTLLTLSALKFALVAMFYMHLKFDARLFSWLFVVPMIVIAVIIILLLRLFGKW
jgi:cytochrome c oxidase subunit 4